MATLSSEYLEIVKDKYYKDKLPMRAVAEYLGVSIDSVMYFMRKNKLARRTYSEEGKRRFDGKNLSFSIKENLSETEKELMIMAVSMYWCEGGKTQISNGIDFANSDTNLTSIPLSQFTKPYIRTDFNLIKTGKMSKGMVHIRYSDKKLLLIMLQWIEEYKAKFAPVV